MALPPGITKKLLQATSDKTDLNKQALRFNRSFKEVGKLLGSGSAKAKKDKDKKSKDKKDKKLKKPEHKPKKSKKEFEKRKRK